ncbi:putative zinc ribbon protein [Pectobacterium polaris]|uniref:putative zinc ribbon protein n=1 Tax=Pectobacterium polaris TaxID=2042057 RepID=UPI0023AEF562|nr:putative zinc ribbon protein [Pectobacterium polaris]MDE8740629.1 putative zinc ribbon protein [Pectobacterium polaris]MDE8756518.1 putative zinc ribbon protein [Pectobacterium polaris]
MRFLKCYLANNAKNRFVNATEANRLPQGHWTCTSCGCRLTLHNGSQHEEAWFEHDRFSIDSRKLKACAYRDPEEKEEERIKKLREQVFARYVLPKPKNWYCALCQKDYTGKKLCPTCKDGIYSVVAREKGHESEEEGNQE